MCRLLRKIACIAALALPTLVFGADTPVQDAGQKSRLEFVRHAESVAFLKARIDVNGQPLDELGKGGRVQILIDPGLAIVTIDEALAPGKFQFAFTAEKGAEYLFEITSDGVDLDHLFGLPPKAKDGKILVNGGPVKVTLFSVKPAKPLATGAAQTGFQGQDAAAATRAPSSVREQLQLLKDLHDQGLISNEVYNAKQQQIIDDIR